MMIIRVLVPVLFFAVGCSSSSSDGNGGTTGTQTCAAVLACAMTCTDQACAQTCTAKASSAAQPFWTAFTDCVAGQCWTDAGACVTAPTSAACQACGNTAATGVCKPQFDACAAN
jgi:hypothetical protein